MRFFAKKIYSGRLTEKVMELFSDMVGKAATQSINELVNDRLTSALTKEQETQKELIQDEIEEEDETRIVTTEEEWEGYHIVRSIVRSKVEAERIVPRDTISYFGVLLDDNNRKPICRLHFNSSNKYLGLFDENKREKRILLNSIDDIFSYSQELIDAALRYDKQN